jgi:hypothetical protein
VPKASRLCKNQFLRFCHSHESGNPVYVRRVWIPAGVHPVLDTGREWQTKPAPNRRQCPNFEYTSPLPDKSSSGLRVLDAESPKESDCVKSPMRCHPRERGNPYHANIGWISTFVGMTITEVLVFTQPGSFGYDLTLIDSSQLKLGYFQAG